AQRLHHESRQQPLPPCARASGVDLSLSPALECRNSAATARSAAGSRDSRLEGATAPPSALSTPRVSQAATDRRRRGRARTRRLPVGRDAGSPARSPAGSPHRGGPHHRLTSHYAPALGSRASLGSKGEHSRGRYAARVCRSEIRAPRMRQLPTNPILAAPAWQRADRRISAGFTVDAAPGHATLPRPLTPAQSYQRRRPTADESVDRRTRGSRARVPVLGFLAVNTLPSSSLGEAGSRSGEWGAVLTAAGSRPNLVLVGRDPPFTGPAP